MIKLAKTSYAIVQQAQKCKSECRNLCSRRLLDSEIDDEREKIFAEALTFKAQTDEYARQVPNQCRWHAIRKAICVEFSKYYVIFILIFFNVQN